MTPKEKAIELVDKMYGVTDYQAKQSALIAVDEILNNNKILFEDVLNDQYWQNVKQEIEKL
jgi:hypothetical protein